MVSPDPLLPHPVAFIGFGEAAMAIADGWRAVGPVAVRAYDLKTDSPQAGVRAGKMADFERSGVSGCAGLAPALAEVPLVLSTVTADQALVAARAAAPLLAAGALFLDCNSVAPDSKRAAAAAIAAAGGRYVDVAVMAPIHPRRHRTPMLLAGPHAEAARVLLERLDMRAQIAGPEIGAASAIKMIRSVMVKGLEALTVECVLAGRRAGVAPAVLESLDTSYPGFDWPARAAYMLERVTTHGVRRAAEMREVAATVRALGLDDAMARATAGWQDRVGRLGVDAGALEEDGYAALADAILARLDDAPPPAESSESKETV